MLTQGSVELKTSTGALQLLTKGEKFGEISLFYNTVRLCEARAKEKTLCLVVGREHLATLKRDSQKHFINAYARVFLESVYSLRMLKKSDFDYIMSYATLHFHQSGQVFIEEGASIEFLYVIIEGSLKSLIDANKLIMDKAGVWGELKLDDIKDRRNADETIIYASDSVVMKIPIKIIIERNELRTQKLNEGSMEKLNDADGSRFAELKYSTFIKSHKMNENKIYHYEIGIFKEFESTPFILKVFSKAQLENRKLVKYLHWEQRCLTDTNFCFVAQLINTILEEDKHIFVLKYIDGATLYEVIRNIGLLSSFDCQFYMASILLILQELRQNSFIHRDIKPENFIVDPEGYLHLFDCSTIKQLRGSYERTRTIIGTPHYMPPEIIEGKDYSFEADIWSAGVCLYEFLTGAVPFGDEEEDPFYIFELVLQGRLEGLGGINDSKLVNLTQMMLDPLQKNREKYSPENLLNHSCFDKLDLAGLKSMHLNQVPYKTSKRVLQMERTGRGQGIDRHKYKI